MNPFSTMSRFLNRTSFAPICPRRRGCFPTHRKRAFVTIAGHVMLAKRWRAVLSEHSSHLLHAAGQPGLYYLQRVTVSPAAGLSLHWTCVVLRCQQGRARKRHPAGRVAGQAVVRQVRCCFAPLRYPNPHAETLWQALICVRLSSSSSRLCATSLPSLCMNALFATVTDGELT